MKCYNIPIQIGDLFHLWIFNTFFTFFYLFIFLFFYFHIFFHLHTFSTQFLFPASTQTQIHTLFSRFFTLSCMKFSTAAPRVRQVVPPAPDRNGGGGHTAAEPHTRPGTAAAPPAVPHHRQSGCFCSVCLALCSSLALCSEAKCTMVGGQGGGGARKQCSLSSWWREFSWDSIKQGVLRLVTPEKVVVRCPVFLFYLEVYFLDFS